MQRASRLGVRRSSPVDRPDRLGNKAYVGDLPSRADFLAGVGRIFLVAALARALGAQGFGTTFAAFGCVSGCLAEVIQWLFWPSGSAVA
jgi:hypothetical protein